MIPNYNHYDLNPPEPIALPMEQDPNGLDQNVIDEHIYEQEYEEQHLTDFVDFEDVAFNELIKHEQKQSF